MCSFLAFESRGFPCVLECGFLWDFGLCFFGFFVVVFLGFFLVGFLVLVFFPHVLVSACAKNLGSNALLSFCLWLWGETDESGIRNTSISLSHS